MTEGHSLHGRGHRGSCSGWQNEKTDHPALQSRFDARRSGGRLSGLRVRALAGSCRLLQAQRLGPLRSAEAPQAARRDTRGADCGSPFIRTVTLEISGGARKWPQAQTVWRAAPSP